MKKTIVLSMLVSLVMICSCQKQESTAEAQLARRKAELDAREHALDEREKALVERERAAANARPIRPELQSRQQLRDPAEVEAEREKRLQQLPPELRALIPDRSKLNPADIAKDREAALQQQARDPAQAEAERERRIQQLPPEFRALIPDRARLESLKAQQEKAIQDRAVQTQRSFEDSRNNMSGSAAPAAEAPDAGAMSPSPSPPP